jgi:stress response protein YsnF
MLNETQLHDVVGSTAYDPEGQKIGKVGQLFLDDETGRPEFVTVNTGLFGTNESFVPVEDATFDGDRLMLPYAKDKVKDAPNIEFDGQHLDHGDERRLYEFYGRSYAERQGGGQDNLTAGAPAGSEGEDTSGPETDTAMSRSEEHLEATATNQEVGRARLRKYVTTETETVQVPVRKERAVVEREPITDSNIDQALDGVTFKHLDEFVQRPGGVADGEKCHVG